MLEYKRDPSEGDIEVEPITVKIIGVGGAGANVLDRMALEGVDAAELVSANTDVRALGSSVANTKIQLGKNLTQGLAAGGDPDVGLNAAIESQSEIRSVMQGRPIVFICAGLGGGTGSGAAPHIAKVAREEGAFVISFVTTPFSFEGKRRLHQAADSLRSLGVYSNALITFDNDRMGDLVLPKEGITQAFEAADQIISQSVRAVCDMVSQRGLIQVGLDDLLTALKVENSRCVFGYGQAKGENRALEAVTRALKSPLLDKGQLLRHANNVIVQCTGGKEMSLFEVETLMKEVSKHVEDHAQILFGLSADPKLGDSISVTILSSIREKEIKPQKAGIIETSSILGSEENSKKPEAPSASSRSAEPSPAPIATRPQSESQKESAPKPIEPIAKVVPAASPVPPVPSLAEPKNNPAPAPNPVSQPAEAPKISTASLATSANAGSSKTESPKRKAEPLPEPIDLGDDLPDLDVGALDELDTKSGVEAPPVLPKEEPSPPPTQVDAPESKSRVFAKELFDEEETKPVAVKSEPKAPKEVLHQSLVQEELLPQRKTSRGRFEKGEPTIIDGEDFDVPTYLRKK